MDLILCTIVFSLISIGLVFFAKWANNNIGVYDMVFCRDVLARLGMFAYKSDLEAMRKKLNCPESKF